MTSKWFLASLVLVVAAAAGTVMVWAEREAWLPERVPIHWGISGQPDGFMPRESMLPWLLLLPGVMLGMALLGRILPWLSPKNFEVDSFRSTYEQVFFICVLMFGYMTLVVLLAQTGQLVPLDRWLIGGLVLLLGALGNLLGKVRRNFYVGVKTPWTLASETVWDRTHRLAAWLTVTGAAAGMVLLAVPAVHPLVALAPVAAGLVAPVFYSLWLYKRLEAQGKLESQQT